MKGHQIPVKILDEVYQHEPADINAIGDKQIIKYRTKTIKSGDVLECEIYPVWKTYSEVRKAKASVSAQAQINLNHKNRVKNVIRLVNANFTDKDIWATYTYSDDLMPLTYDEAIKEMTKYIRRLKNYTKKHNQPELKYIYVTELSKKGRFHHHIVINFQDRDVAEQLWKGGKRKQTRRLQADESGYEGLARYITKEEIKDSPNRKNYICSKNLIKPTITTSDYKVSRAQARKIAEGKINPIVLFQKLYQSYAFNDITFKTSDYVSGVYLYVKMHRLRI